MMNTDAIYDRMKTREHLSNKYTQVPKDVDIVPLDDMTQESQEAFMDLKIITYLVNNQSYTPELFDRLKTLSNIMSRKMFLSSMKNNIV